MERSYEKINNSGKFKRRKFNRVKKHQNYITHHNNDLFNIDPLSIESLSRFFRLDNKPFGCMRNSEDFIEYFIHRRAALSEIISQDALEIVERNIKLTNQYLYDEEIDFSATEALTNPARYESEYKKFLQVNKMILDINDMKKKKRVEN